MSSCFLEQSIMWQDMPKNSCEGAETGSEWAKRILINNSLEMMNKKIIISKSGTVGWRIKWKKIILVIDAMYFCSCKKTAKKFRLQCTGFKLLTSASNSGAVLYQMSQQANSWVQVIELVH